ncbi:alpha/beta fold hydrolase [Variovorax sp. J2P1-59]|uniref:alpha/beta hydrolase family protein n=1 Tax=Variovorax flavidus TaxID=3053501 RepID=UPI0025785593|nr:alpha/beta fold hydrolase [Variovorax sp. J2P1-59]MDM0078499.1 alpha/beta fold hydrolase [Variovorax sp. J2P1-59]
MTPTTKQVRISVGGTEEVQGVIVAAPTSLPGILIVHGWDSDQAHYQIRAEDLAALGCVCLTFDLRGHGQRQDVRASVSRHDNLCDVLAAFDLLARQTTVDPKAMALIGTSYGGYLAAIASAARDVRWMALRVPALYPDDGWDVPKKQLDRAAIRTYREQVRPPDSDRALRACQAFRGDAFVVGSTRDDLVPREGIASYVRALQGAKSITHRMIEGADHGLSDERSQRTYDGLLSAWLTEMILGARTPRQR